VILPSENRSYSSADRALVHHCWVVCNEVRNRKTTLWLTYLLGLTSETYDRLSIIGFHSTLIAFTPLLANEVMPVMPNIPSTAATGNRITWLWHTFSKLCTFEESSSIFRVLLLVCIVVAGVVGRLCVVWFARRSRRVHFGNMASDQSPSEDKGSNSIETPKCSSPWISPPKQLPGPYDPRLLPPLPNPTLHPGRRHSYPVPPIVETPSKEIVIAHYTKRVPSPSSGTDRIYHGQVILGSNKESSWRRHQWTMQAG
jgi:hypothetical protein